MSQSIPFTTTRHFSPKSLTPRAGSWSNTWSALSTTCTTACVWPFALNSAAARFTSSTLRPGTLSRLPKEPSYQHIWNATKGLSNLGEFTWHSRGLSHPSALGLRTMYNHCWCPIAGDTSHRINCREIRIRLNTGHPSSSTEDVFDPLRSHRRTLKCKRRIRDLSV